MYCPRCGQQQISEEMRFCSRCGLPLSGLTDWLAVSGLAPGPEQQKQAAMHSPRRKGIRRGGKIMFFSAALAPIFLMFSLLIDEPFPLVFPFIAFIVGLTILLYSRIFVDDFPAISSQPNQQFGLGTMPQAHALPHASNNPLYSTMNIQGQHVRTNELAQPASVTEHTTKLLDHE